MAIIIRKGKHLYIGVVWRLAGDSYQNASLLSFLAGLVQGTPGLGNGELRKALCPFPAARSRAHCLGVGSVTLDWAVPTRREDNAAAAAGEAAAADCGGRPEQYCRAPPASFRAARTHAEASAH